jgi:hypothetical protein
MTSEKQPWFVFTIRDADAAGVEIPKLTRLLANLSSALYVIARAKIGKAGRKPGRRGLAEDALAGARLVRVEPGSTVIELAPPPEDASKPRLPGFDEPLPDDIVFAFYDDVERIYRGDPPEDERWDIRRQVIAVIEDAGDIGSQAEIAYRPRPHRLRPPGRDVLQKSFSTRDLPEEPESVSRASWTRVVSGHAYMVDVEPGRERLRVKLPDGRDMTIEVDSVLASKMANALDRVVELRVEEEMEGDTPAKRVVHDLTVVDSEADSDRPSKSVQELALEQGLPSKRPDYVALASAIWRTEQELAEFEEHLRQIRQAEPG